MPMPTQNLRVRFFRGLPYTYTGEICIAVNPFRWLDLYQEVRACVLARACDMA